jgi:hypothetical protein
LSETVNLRSWPSGPVLGAQAINNGAALFPMTLAVSLAACGADEKQDQGVRLQARGMS